MRTWDAMGGAATIDWPRAPSVEELHCGFPALELPVLSLGTLFVSDDSVAVSGAVSSEVAPTAELEINGHRVPVAEWGSFCAVVRLQGQTRLKLSLNTEAQKRVTLDLPLRSG